MSKEIEDRVNAILAENQIAYAVSLLGATKRDDWECDAWHVVITYGQKNEMYTFDFYTGIGQRDESMLKKQAKFVKAVPGTIYYRNLARNYPGKAVKPRAASVLHSILNDGEAINMSFDDWAGEYGYDRDSLKALNTYNACCETGRKVRAIFKREVKQQLLDALQDY